MTRTFCDTCDAEIKDKADFLEAGGSQVVSIRFGRYDDNIANVEIGGIFRSLQCFTGRVVENVQEKSRGGFPTVSKTS